MKTYLTHVFDVDGVLLDSNGVKSRAFYEAALPYGEEAALALVAYHQTAGSIGRERRWHHFFEAILGRLPRPGEFEDAMARCSELVCQGTAAAHLVPGVRDYLEALGRQRCVVVSGIEQGELESILVMHDLQSCFSRIWGGPRTKPVLFRDLLCARDIDLPSIYYGDQEEDLLSARNAGLDFIWVRGCAEWSGVQSVQDFRELLSA